MATCGGHSDLTQCGSDFPSDFCCPNFWTCVTLLNSTSAANAQAVLCCPPGASCATVVPVNCDASLLNATTSPESQIHMDPISPLPACGSVGCCPPDYSCQESSQCTANAGQKAVASNASSSSSIVPTGSSSSSGQTSATSANLQNSLLIASTASSSMTAKSAAASGVNATATPPSSSHGGTAQLGSTDVVLIGVLVACAIVAVAAAALCVACVRRKRRRQGQAKAEPAAHGLGVMYEKAELDGGVSDGWWKRLSRKELGAGSSPKELSSTPKMFATRQEMNGLQSPRELPATPKRPRTLNSIRQELKGS